MFLRMHSFVVLSIFSLFSWVSYAFGCPSGWVAYKTEKCLKYVPVNVNYSEAEQLCRSSDSVIASVHSRDEQDFVQALGRKHSSQSGVHWVWLGAVRDHSETEHFYWKDDSVLNYTGWREGCPDKRPDENCVLMTIFRDRPSHWCNFKCDSNYDHVICQKPWTNETSSFQPTNASSVGLSRVRSYTLFPVPVLPTLRPWLRRSTRDPQSVFCPLGWTIYDNVCYKFISENITGEQAKYYCSHFFRGASAVTIHSEPQQTFLTNFLFYSNEAKEAVWLGAKRRSPAAEDIGWADGSPMDYTNWSPHEPDNRNGSESCVAINDMSLYFGRWIDAPCELMFHLVCQKPSSATVTTTRTTTPTTTRTTTLATDAPRVFESNFIQKPRSDNLLSTDRKEEPTSEGPVMGVLIFFVVTLAVIVAFLLLVVHRLRQQMSQNLSDSRLNIYYDVTSPETSPYESTLSPQSAQSPNKYGRLMRPPLPQRVSTIS